MTKIWCVGGRHFANTINISEHEKRNPKTKKLVKIYKKEFVVYVDEIKVKLLLSK